MPSYPKQAMVMAAGRGERCRPLTLVTPKPLIIVRNQHNTCLGLILDQLQSLSFDKIIVNAYYLADQVINYVREHYPAVIVSHEPEPLETGGGLLHALTLIDPTAPLFVMNSDSYIKDLDVHVTSMYQQFENIKDNQNAVLLGISQVNPALQQGIGYDNPPDYAVDPASNRLTHRSLAGIASHVFIGPRIFGKSYLNADYLKGFQINGKSFSQLCLMNDAQAQSNLYGHEINAPWLSISTTQDVENVRAYFNS